MFSIELVSRCKKNDRLAQLELYEKYCDGMFKVAMGFVKDPDDAEDVVQEAFIKAFKKIDQFNAEVTFGAWLKRIVVHQSIDFLKSKKREILPLNENLIVVKEDDDWSVDNSVTVNEVKLAMERLSEKYRYVVMMYLIEGLDHSEISQVLGITETNCRSRLFRGKAQLKDILNQKAYVTRS
ncbi:hypothetical protein LCGC14_1025460 [marine sediment metagenome]|uniref:RNA polymerase sigma factor n=2 Tax=root TaxID=1 RepID=A0A831QLE8_9FLAO|nr:RNA polymerase sigma factor [Pricia antarctica]